MKLDEVAKSGNDEFYTPPYAVEPILKYIEPHSNVWCPFDTADSWFVKLLEMNGHNVVRSHLDDGHDFFKTEAPTGVDYIISNPPYSVKGEVLSRLFDLGVPFAMLVGGVGIFESQKRFDMFKENDFEIMYMNRRVSYFQDYAEQKPSKNPPFSSVYLTSGVLPEKIIFEEIDKTNLMVKE